MELWKSIVGFEDYRISSEGRVWSIKSNKYLSPTKDSDGYLIVGLFNNGRQTKKKVHRLVAEHFLLNFDNGKQVNHKDEDKTNNRVGNLEMCTSHYNINYGSRNQKVSEKLSINPPRARRAVAAFAADGTVVHQFESLHAAERAGFNRSAIYQVCSRKSRLKSYRGLDWRYIA